MIATKTGKQKDRMLGRLENATYRARKDLEEVRKFAKRARKQIAGPHYGANSSEKSVPVNLLELYVNTYSRALAASQPKALVYTPHIQLRPQASELELGLNHLSDEITLDATLREAVIEALMGMAIIKVGVADGPQVEVGGVMHDVGQPYADLILFDDWVHDTGARRIEQCSFMGYRQRLPIDYVKGSKAYQNRDLITRTSRGPTDQWGDERADQLGRSEGADDDEFMDYVEVWEYYLPMEGGKGRCITVPVENPNLIIRDYEWDGPECGPFHFLRFNPLPGQIMPAAPLSTVYDLHMSVNAMWRKMDRQAQRLKRLVLFSRGNDRDAKNVRSASDGEAAAVSSPSAQDIVETTFGGIDQMLLAFAMQAEEKFSEMAGNLNLQAGISPQSETIGQDQMLAQAASQRMSDMQDQMVRFTQGVMKSLAWWMWHDPTIRVPLVKRVQGIPDASVAAVFSAEDTEGDWLDYNFQIEPYSMQFQPPAQRLNTILQWWNQVALPAMPFYQAAGVMPDIVELTRLISKYGNTPEIMDVMQLQGASEEGQRGPVQPGEEGPPKPAATTRTYQRVNHAPGPTKRNQNRMMIDKLMGGASEGNGGGY